MTSRDDISTSADVAPDGHWTLSFSPPDRRFYMAVNGQDCFRTDSPELACGYFMTRLRP